jgi:hypothetical protein
MSAHLDEQEIRELHQEADLLGLAHHEHMTPEQLRAAIRARRQGADPRQAERISGDSPTEGE